MFTIKAYPWGRWYAPRKKISTGAALVKARKRLEGLDQQEKLTDTQAVPVSEAKTKAAEEKADKEKALAEYEYLEAVRNTLDKSTELLPLLGSTFYHRFSVFYGRSPGSFNETKITGPVNAIGIAYDIAPEFAFFLGRAYYEENISGGGSGSREHLIFGVQMNFNAFSSFRKQASQ